MNSDSGSGKAIHGHPNHTIKASLPLERGEYQALLPPLTREARFY
jgi:hypothetical protein